MVGPTNLIFVFCIFTLITAFIVLIMMQSSNNTLEPATSKDELLNSISNRLNQLIKIGVNEIAGKCTDKAEFLNQIENIKSVSALQSPLSEDESLDGISHLLEKLNQFEKHVNMELAKNLNEKPIFRSYHRLIINTIGDIEKTMKLA